MSTLPPHGSQFSFLIEAPHILYFIRNLVSEDGSTLRPHIQVAGGEDDFVCFEGLAVGKEKAGRKDFGDFAAGFDFDLSVGDELGTANIDVVSMRLKLASLRRAGVEKNSRDDCGVISPDKVY